MLFVAFLMYATSMCLMVLGLTTYHHRLITINLTTNEDMNKFRYDYLRDKFGMYSNPFNAGKAWTNVMVRL
jgi:hypothetical protein